MGRAADIAYDSAGDSAYNNGWTQGSNGGFGWGGGWIINTLPNGAIIGDSTTNGGGDPEGDGDINSPRAIGGRAWGAPGANATRMFSGPLSVGQTFAIDYDNPGIASPNYFSYLDLLAPDGFLAIRYSQDLISGTSFQGVLTGVFDTGQGIHLEFTQLSSGVDVSITPYISGAPIVVDFVPYTGQIVGVELISVTTMHAEAPALTPYINNIAITPEPSSAALLGLAACVLLTRRRRRPCGASENGQRREL